MLYHCRDSAATLSVLIELLSYGCSTMVVSSRAVGNGECKRKIYVL